MIIFQGYALFKKVQSQGSQAEKIITVSKKAMFSHEARSSFICNLLSFRTQWERQTFFTFFVSFGNLVIEQFIRVITTNSKSSFNQSCHFWHYARSDFAACLSYIERLSTYKINNILAGVGRKSKQFWLKAF